MKQTTLTEQEIAMKWWKPLSDHAKYTFFKFCYPERMWSTFEEKDIHSIWEKEGKPVSDNSEGVEATPGKWELIEPFLGMPRIGVKNPHLNVCIAHIQIDEGKEIAEANAALICEAVNNYQSLKEDVVILKEEITNQANLVREKDGYIQQLKQENERLKDINRELLACLEGLLNTNPDLPTRLNAFRVKSLKTINKAKSLNL